jgi:hypothetical protein
MSLVICELQQCHRQVPATLGDLFFGGAIWSKSPDFQGENPSSDLSQLYLAIVNF